MSKHLLVLTTVPDFKTGRSIARSLVEGRLCACATLSAPCQSMYWWEDKVTDEEEHTLFIKTRTDLYPELEKKIREHHPYEVPEIIALPLHQGSPAYLKWIDEVTRP